MMKRWWKRMEGERKERKGWSDDFGCCPVVEGSAGTAVGSSSGEPGGKRTERVVEIKRSLVH